jgi:hypothetical protein
MNSKHDNDYNYLLKGISHLLTLFSYPHWRCGSGKDTSSVQVRNMSVMLKGTSRGYSLRTNYQRLGLNSQHVPCLCSLEGQ